MAVRRAVAKWEILTSSLANDAPSPNSRKRRKTTLSAHRSIILLDTFNDAVKEKKQEEKEESSEEIIADTKNEEVCSICWDTITDKEFILLCGHEFCTECLKELLRIKIFQEKAERVVCPWEECASEISEAEIKIIAGEATVDALQRTKLMLSLLRNPHTRYCPIPHCSYLIQNASPSNPEIQCSSCFHKFCFFCSRKPHKNMSCEENHHLLERTGKLENDPTEQFEIWKKTFNIRNCPRCSIPVVKNGGCNHMTCTACKYEFCWICSAKFNPTHFMESINCRVNEPGVDVPDYPVFHSTRCSGTQKSAPVKKKKKERVILPKIFSRIRRRLINQEAVHSTTEVVPKSKNGTYHYRFVALGRSGVGKSCVCYRYSNQSWVGGYFDPTVEDSFRKQIVLDGRKCMLEFIENGGMDEFEALRDQNICRSDGFLLIFSFENISTLDYLESVILTIERLKDKEHAQLPIVIAANAWEVGYFNGDLPRAMDFAKAFNIPLITCSARNSVNIPLVFEELVRQMHHFGAYEYTEN